MNDDIRFYDFELNLLHILPPYTGDVGYSSINTTSELNNSGSLEIVFYDNDLKRTVEGNKDNIIVIWRDFCGFITSYNFKSELRLMGMSLNGLLHRAVIPATDGELEETVENLAKSALQNVDWIEFKETGIFTNSVTYETEKYMTADTYIQNLLALDNAGYKISADVINKKYIFECIQLKENELLLSENNLNAYDVESNYNNKNLAFGGWYKERQENDADGNAVDPIWKYITLDDAKEGIYKIDTVLEAETATEALNKLKECKAIYELTAKTRDIQHNVDYSIGDVIRVQEGETTTKKVIGGVRMWNETSYGEEPILIENGTEVS